MDNLAKCDEKSRQIQDKNDIRYLQVLRALIHNQVKLVDLSLKEKGKDPELYRQLALSNYW